MLQRIQTYYLAIIIIIQGVVASGMEFFRFSGGGESYSFNSWGVTHYSADNKAIETSIYPVFIGFIALALLAFLCIMSYKNLDRQLKLGRTIFYLYFVSVLSLYLFATFGDSWMPEEIESREMGLAYWLFIAGFPFSFLANTGIKRDKRLLDSLKRL